MTNQSVGLLNYLARVPDGSLKELSNYFAGVAVAKPSAADYAFSVRKLYDRLVKETGQDAELLRECLLLLVSEQQGLGLISKQHRRLLDQLLPKPKLSPKAAPPDRKRRRPKGAFGKAAHGKRYELYRDWKREKALNPSLTKDEFVKKRLGITEAEFEEDFDLDDPNADGPLHRKVAALLQDLRPARMRSSLAADQREGTRTGLSALGHEARKLGSGVAKGKATLSDIDQRSFFAGVFQMAAREENC